MKRTAISFLGAFALFTAGALAGAPAQACDGKCDHAKGAHADKANKTKMVSLEGRIETVGCPMEAAKEECTGAALVLGDEKLPIKKAQKGDELVNKTRDSNKTVKVKGTRRGDYVTVASYTIKG